ncbi:MAG: hypothetical protein WC884_01015 [Candidatus Paceibacterota bacterium]
MKYNISMRKARILLTLGFWVTILPYLGFPYSWKDVLFTLSGLGLIYFSYVLYKESKIKEVQENKVFDNFSENNYFKEDEKGSEDINKEI